MKKKTPSESLKDSILLLEMQQKDQRLLMKTAFSNVCDRLKPINFLRSTLTEMLQASDVKESVFDTSLAMMVGYFSQKISASDTKSPLKQLFGTLLQFGVVGVVKENTERIKSWAKNALKLIFK